MGKWDQMSVLLIGLRWTEAPTEVRAQVGFQTGTEVVMLEFLPAKSKYE